MSRTSSRGSRLFTVKQTSKSTRRKRPKREKSKEFRVVNKTWDGTQQSTRDEKEAYSEERRQPKGYNIKRGDSNPKKKFEKMMKKISKNQNDISVMNKRVKMNMGNEKVSQTYDHRYDRGSSDQQSRVPSHQLLRKSRKF